MGAQISVAFLSASQSQHELEKSLVKMFRVFAIDYPAYFVSASMLKIRIVQLTLTKIFESFQ